MTPEIKVKSWTLTYNHLDDREMNKAYPWETVEFQLFDDDENLYFTGFMSPDLEAAGEQIFEPLDYAMAAWGCTDMKINGESI